jgi:hypothetical protein
MTGQSSGGGASSVPDVPASVPGGAVPLPASVLDRYPRFSCYNSPYPAHDRGCAVDLYPESNRGLSPVAGEVLDTRTVRCPDQPYAVDHDHLIVVDVDDDWAGGAGRDLVARILHVDPAVSSGDRVAVGDSLGEMVRSGFFGQWVDNHVHLGFRRADQNPHRASGSLPVAPQVEVTGAPWGGTGTVVEVGETFARLDAPAHPDPGSWATLAADDGTPLDGGLVHYSGGGAYAAAGDEETTLSLLGTDVGVSRTRTGGGTDVDWADVAVRANGVRATGLSLFASQATFGAKLVFHEGHEFAVGDEVAVEITPTDQPIRLG